MTHRRDDGGGRPDRHPGLRTPARRPAGVLAWLLALACMGGSVSASAEPPRYGGYDWYMAAAGVTGIAVARVNGATPSGGANLTLGFRFNRWLTAEMSGEWMKRFHYDRGSGKTCMGDSQDADSFNAYHFTAGGRLYATQSRLQPFLLGGAGVIQTRDFGSGSSCRRTGFVARLGGGIDLFVDDALAVSLLTAYILPSGGGTKEHDYVSIGLGLTWY